MTWSVSLPRSTFTASPSLVTCTTALGYRPTPLYERVAYALGDLRLQSALEPAITAMCLLTVTLPTRVPAITRPAAACPCFTIEQVEREPERDRTFERASLLVWSYSTAPRASVPFIATG
jgi:hypothetical protein